jgi:hypothetical protein
MVILLASAANGRPRESLSRELPRDFAIRARADRHLAAAVKADALLVQ